MYSIDLIKGIPPGKIIDRELKKQTISQRMFAKKIGVHSQTLNAVIKGKRSLTLNMSLLLEKELSLPEGFLMVLQVYYDIKKQKSKINNHIPANKPEIRKILFWDTDFQNLDWNLQKSQIIKRVKERGNEHEKRELAKFYNLESL